MKYELDVDEHNGVGPFINLYEHGPVTTITQHDEDGEPDGAVFVCLDCGYTAHDRRLFAHEDCNREDNPINTTWRETDIVTFDLE